MGIRTKVERRTAVIAVALILVAVAIVLAALPAPDHRTMSEKLVLTASDLAELNAAQKQGPSPSPYHPVLNYGGSEAAESHFSMTVDGWYLYVECILVLYNSSSSAGQRFQDIRFDTDYAEVSVGDGCLIGDYWNETFGSTLVIRLNFYAIMLENDTITYFAFKASPPDYPGAISPQIIGAIINAQADKVQLGA